MDAIAKYTPAGLEARRNAIATGIALKLQNFKVSNSIIDISEENTLDNLPSFWIEKPITSYRLIGDDIVEFTLTVEQNEATDKANSYALYLEDGTAFIVATPSNTFNENVEQKFLVQIKAVQNGAGEFSFVNIPADTDELERRMFERCLLNDLTTYQMTLHNAELKEIA